MEALMWRFAIMCISLIALGSVLGMSCGPAECVEWAEVITDYPNKECRYGGTITTEALSENRVLVRCACSKPGTQPSRVKALEEMQK